jgi:diguanylate cyclase (GGDEF)-like protein
MSDWYKELIDLLSKSDLSEAELQEFAARHGSLRAEQGAKIESLIMEFGDARRILAARAHSTLSEKLDRALAASAAAWFHARSTAARVDPVTGLPDRAAFELSLRDEIARAERYGREFSLVLLDRDDFKTINDRFGHPEGDRVLAQVARTLRAKLRRTDQIFRYGGDEFAALCPETGRNALHAVLERLEARTGQLGSLEVAISWGVASFPADATLGAELVRLADERLYTRKREHHLQG